MLIKLAALSALGYGAWKYVQSAKTAQGSTDRSLAVAGGPLSDQARLAPAGSDLGQASAQPGRTHGHLL